MKIIGANNYVADYDKVFDEFKKRNIDISGNDMDNIGDWIYEDMSSILKDDYHDYIESVDVQLEQPICFDGNEFKEISISGLTNGNVSFYLSKPLKRIPYSPKSEEINAIREYFLNNYGDEQDMVRFANRIVGSISSTVQKIRDLQGGLSSIRFLIENEKNENDKSKLEEIIRLVEKEITDLKAKYPIDVEFLEEQTDFEFVCGVLKDYEMSKDARPDTTIEYRKVSTYFKVYIVSRVEIIIWDFDTTDKSYDVYSQPTQLMYELSKKALNK